MGPYDIWTELFHVWKAVHIMMYREKSGKLSPISPSHHPARPTQSRSLQNNIFSKTGAYSMYLDPAHITIGDVFITYVYVWNVEKHLSPTYETTQPCMLFNRSRSWSTPLQRRSPQKLEILVSRPDQDRSHVWNSGYAHHDAHRIREIRRTFLLQSNSVFISNEQISSQKLGLAWPT